MSGISWVDSHAHLTSEAVYPDLAAVLERAQQAGVTQIVNIATDIQTFERGLILAQQRPWIKLAAATTPHDAATLGDSDFETFAAAARAGKLIAVGETGLDYHYEHSPREKQKSLFRRYLALALECKLPIVIHCRDAFEDFFSILDSDYPNRPGILHCFTGTLQEAEELIKRGWFISFSGIVTFKKSQELQAVVQSIPLDKILIETDTPYLAPEGFRGKQNEPSYLTRTGAFIAQLRQLPLAEFAEATSKNFQRAFSRG